MNDKTFIGFAKEFLHYSFEEIDFNYDLLTQMEQGLISREEFDLFVDKITE
jgi:hypothetical protein